jgi:acetyl-CoA carboxylase biotin carboxyl carrier protein
MDEQFILTVMEKFNVSSLSEFKLDDGTTRMVLRKETAQFPTGAAVSQGRGGPEEAPVHLGISANPVHSADGEKITSPIVATFYASPGPDAPPFVSTGSKIKAGQTLCILEAMKMMNHLEAEFDCEIKETHVSSGELVEYGQILFTVHKL